MELPLSLVNLSKQRVCLRQHMRAALHKVWLVVPEQHTIVEAQIQGRGTQAQPRMRLQRTQPSWNHVQVQRVRCKDLRIAMQKAQPHC